MKLKSADIELSKVVMGTWQADQRRWPGVKGRHLGDAYRYAIEHGITTFDTAEVYAGSERLLARSLGADIHKIVLLDKVFANHLQYDAVIEACERSLNKLGREYIDLYQIHWPSGSFNQAEVPLEETLRAMDALKQQGKIRAIGVSNFSLSQLQQACALSDIESIQLPYSLLWRRLDVDIRPFCEANNIAILAYSSLAQGLLTAKFSLNHQFAEDDNRRNNVLFSQSHFADALAVVDQSAELARGVGVSPGALALAWVAAQPNTVAIAGAKTVTQTKLLLESMRVNPNQQLLTSLSEIAPDFIDAMAQYPKMWQ